MRFIDEVEIYVRAGDGGHGMISFRREAHVPLGGPSGGDGGRGGDIEIVATRDLATLLDLRYQRHYKAEAGVKGLSSNMHGRCGEPTVIHVPCGTLVYDAETGEEIGDLVEPGARLVAARGGIGGKGNARFSTSTNRAPRIAEEGTPGEERRLRLELKLLAEVGLVGLPSAGKSTLISKVSAAKPKIADYHFTTLVPNLGVVRLSGGDRSFVMADIPGLIEGASDGAGLGHRFLRHVERTAVLVYLLDDRHHDVGEPGGPVDDLRVLHRELAAHDPELAAKPTLVVLNKTDAIDAERSAELLAELSAAAAELPNAAPLALAISAATGKGLPPLLEAIWPIVAEGRRERAQDDPNTPPAVR